MLMRGKILFMAEIFIFLGAASAAGSQCEISKTVSSRSSREAPAGIVRFKRGSARFKEAERAENRARRGLISLTSLQEMGAQFPFIEAQNKSNQDYIGNIDSMKFHLPSCEFAQIMAKRRRVFFQSAEKA